MGKTLDSNDQNQVADQRFSLKQWFAGGAQSRGFSIMERASIDSFHTAAMLSPEGRLETFCAVKLVSQHINSRLDRRNLLSLAKIGHRVIRVYGMRTYYNTCRKLNVPII